MGKRSRSSSPAPPAAPVVSLAQQRCAAMISMTLSAFRGEAHKSVVCGSRIRFLRMRDSSGIGTACFLIEADRPRSGVVLLGGVGDNTPRMWATVMYVDDRVLQPHPVEQERVAAVLEAVGLST